MVPDVGPDLAASEPALNHYSGIIFLLSVFLSLPKKSRQNSHVPTIKAPHFIFLFHQLDTILLNSYVYNTFITRVTFKKLIENKTINNMKKNNNNQKPQTFAF